MFKRTSEPVRAVLLAAALVAGYLLLGELVTLAVLVVMVVIVSLALDAFAGALERRGVPRVLGALLGMLGGLSVLAGIGALLVPPFVAQVQDFVDRVPEILDGLRTRIGQATGSQPSEVGLDVQSELQDLIDEPMRLIGPLATIGLGLAGAIASAVLVLMTAFYVAVRPRPLVDGILALFGPRRRESAALVLEEIRTAWLGWLRGVGIDMLITGALLYVGLAAIGLDFALAFAVLSALLVVIPYYGAVVGGIPPVLFALADSPTLALATLAVYIAVQQIEGNLIVPLVMSRTVSLHPALIIVGVVVVGRLFGILGLFVAVPLLSAAVILVRHLWVEPLEVADTGRGQRLLRVTQAHAPASEAAQSAQTDESARESGG